MESASQDLGFLRVGHVALRVPDLAGAIDFYGDVLGLVATERVGDRAYLTCNERHHELILVESTKSGYEELGLEAADEKAAAMVCERSSGFGGKRLGDASAEPGVAGGYLLEAPGGHRFKLFWGMETVSPPPADELGIRPSRFEHISLKSTVMGRLERFISEGLGFRFSDRMGKMASWWHCEAEHHGLAVQRAPQNHLHHHAWTFEDLNTLGRVSDRLHARGQYLTWGPGHHGPGDNRFIYFRDPSKALLEGCAQIAMFGEGSEYQPKTWPFGSKSVSLWGSRLPVPFVLAGIPIRASGR